MGKLESNLTDVQRNAVAAQWNFESHIKLFEAAAVIQNDEKIRERATACHEALDILLAAKEQTYKEYFHQGWKPES